MLTRRDRPTLEHIPASFPLGPRWYVIYTHVHAEKLAQESIEDLGYRVFIPFEKRIRRIPNRKPRPYEAPLFPRYGFVQFEINDNCWGEIIDADGVIEVLCSNDIPVHVPTRIIEQLQLADSMGLLDRTMPAKIGGMVEAMDGPFAGFIGKIMRARSGDKVDVLLKMLGGEITATFPLSSLREA